MKFLSILAVVSTFLVGISHAVTITSPSQGGTITNGQKTTIKWSGSAGGDNVELQYCHYLSATGGQKCGFPIGSGPDTGSYDWTPKDLEDGETYWILMFSGSGSAPVATSGQFTAKASGGSSSSSSSASGSSSGAGTTAAPTGGAASTRVVTITVTGADGSTTTMQATVTGTAGAAAGASSSSGGSSSNGATIGGAVGGAVGGIALVGLGAFLFVRHRKQKKQRVLAAKYASSDVENAAAGVVHNEKDNKDNKDGTNSNRNSKLLGKFRHSKNASTDSAKKGALIPEPAAGVMEMPENPVFEMSAEPEPVEAPSDSRFYAMELDSREILPPSQTEGQDEKKRPGALDPKELRRGDRLSPGIAVSPPGNDSTAVDATGGFGYKPYRKSQEDVTKTEETKAEETKAEETKSEEKKTEEATPEEKKTEAAADTKKEEAPAAEAPREEAKATTDAPKSGEEAAAPATDKPEETKPTA